MSKNVLILIAEQFEDLEVHYPRLRFIEEGFQVTIAGLEPIEYKGKKGYPCKASVAIDEINQNNFDILIIPGGLAPGYLRMDDKVLSIVRHFKDQQKIIGAICHAGSVLISANILQGVNCTSYRAIKDDMINAKAIWHDEQVVIDQNIITSRKPDDLPFFCKAILNLVK